MDQRLAFRKTIGLMEERLHAYPPAAAPYSMRPTHLREMLAQVDAGTNPQRPGEGFSEAKLGRWLGWAQASITAMGLVTLEEWKDLNQACAGESERRIDIVLGRGEWIGATRVVDGEMPALVFARAATPHAPGTPAIETELQEAIAKEVVVIAFSGWQALLHLMEALQHLGTEIAEATGIDIEEGRT